MVLLICRASARTEPIPRVQLRERIAGLERCERDFAAFFDRKLAPWVSEVQARLLERVKAHFSAATPQAAADLGPLQAVDRLRESRHEDHGHARTFASADAALACVRSALRGFVGHPVPLQVCCGRVPERAGDGCAGGGCGDANLATGATQGRRCGAGAPPCWPVSVVSCIVSCVARRPRLRSCLPGSALWRRELWGSRMGSVMRRSAG